MTGTHDPIEGGRHFPRGVSALRGTLAQWWQSSVVGPDLWHDASGNLDTRDRPGAP